MEAVIGLISGFFGIVFFFTTGAVIWKKNWIKPKVKPITFSFNDISEDFVKEAINLNAVIQKHRDINNKKVASQLSAIMLETRELFKRIDETDNRAKLIETSVNYTDIFSKLCTAFGESVYLDVKNNPKYYDNPSEIIKKAESILKVVYDQILENIKQVNRNSDLDFKVALEALVGKQDSNLETVFESAQSSTDNYKTA